MYHTHPDAGLHAAFAKRPYQGAEPGSHDACHVLFIGLDANSDPDIARHHIYRPVLAYLEDGPRFWRANGVHHPFLLPGYTGDGKKYHKNFAQIGLTDAPHADRVSFIELIDLPTTGRSNIEPSDLKPEHLRRIADWIAAPATRLVFISKQAGSLMVKSGFFPWMKARPGATPSVSSLKVRGTAPGGAIAFDHFHFSVYGRWQSNLVKERIEIYQLITECR